VIAPRRGGGTLVSATIPLHSDNEESPDRHIEKDTRGPDSRSG
jgi:hypothetical protein